jgi:cholesterol transport system auxiliary component
MIAIHAYSTGARALICIISIGLTACSVLQPPARAVVYDFGPGALTLAQSATAAAPTTLSTLVLADVEAPASLETTAVLYRLAYSDAQQLRPYAQARWSMAPAQLVRQRVRETLGQQRAVLLQHDGVGTGVPTLTLRVALEEFSQLFDAVEHSAGLVRMRATLSQSGPGGERLVAQRSFVVQRDSASADALGGVRALTTATDAAIAELDLWVRQAK